MSQVLLKSYQSYDREETEVDDEIYMMMTQPQSENKCFLSKVRRRILLVFVHRSNGPIDSRNTICLTNWQSLPDIVHNDKNERQVLPSVPINKPKMKDRREGKNSEKYNRSSSSEAKDQSLLCRRRRRQSCRI